MLLRLPLLTHLVRASELYTQSRTSGRRMKRALIIAAAVVALLLLSMFGLVWSVVVLTKETYVDAGGVTRVYHGSNSGGAVAAAALTDGAGALVTAAGGDARVAQAVYSQATGYGLSALLALSLEEVQAVSKLEAMSDEGQLVTLAITSAEYRELLLVESATAVDEDGEPELFVPEGACGEADNATAATPIEYDWQMRLLAFHTSHRAYPAVLVIETRYLGAGEGALGAAANITALITPEEVGELDELMYSSCANLTEHGAAARRRLRAAAGPDSDSSAGRSLLACCGVRGLRRRVNSLQNEINQWKNKYNDAVANANSWQSSYNSAVNTANGWRDQYNSATASARDFQNRYNSAISSVHSWTATATRRLTSLTGIANTLSSLPDSIEGLAQDAGQVRSDIADLYDVIVGVLKQALDPLANVNGCDLVDSVVDFVDDFLSQGVCMPVACGDEGDGEDGATVLVSHALVNVTATPSYEVCLTPHDLGFDCSAMMAELEAFWAQNPLDDIIDAAMGHVKPAFDAIEDALDAVVATASTIKSAVESAKSIADAATRRQLMLLGVQDAAEADALPARELVRLPSGQLVRHALLELHLAATGGVHESALAAARADIGERMASHFARRELAESDAMRPASLFAKLQVSVGVELRIEAAKSYRYSADLLQGKARLDKSKSFPVPMTAGLVTVRLGMLMDLVAPMLVELSAAGTAVVNVQSTFALDTDLTNPDKFSLVVDSSGSQVTVDAAVVAAASLALQSHVRMEVAVCFIEAACVGVVVEASQDTSIGADAAVQTSAGDIEIEPLLTNYVVYPNADRLADASGLVAWGGLWAYATYPHVRVYAYTEGVPCAPAGATFFEYAPASGLVDLAPSPIPHPLGSMLYRNAIVPFAQVLLEAPTADGGGGGTLTIPLPIETVQMGPGTGLPQSMLRRALAAAPGELKVAAAAAAVEEPPAPTTCGGGRSHNVAGPVPARRVRCPFGGDGAAASAPVGTACRSVDCCSGVAVKAAWNSFVCAPPSLEVKGEQKAQLYTEYYKK